MKKFFSWTIALFFLVYLAPTVMGQGNVTGPAAGEPTQMGQEVKKEKPKKKKNKKKKNTKKNTKKKKKTKKQTIPKEKSATNAY